MLQQTQVVHAQATYTCNKNKTACPLGQAVPFTAKPSAIQKYHILELNLTLRTNTRESINLGCAVDGAAIPQESFKRKNKKF